MKINKDKKVAVYFNITKGCFSVMQNGLVGDNHTDKIALSDAEFVVRKGGRDAVRRDKRKNVHAFVKGYVHPAWSGDVKHARDNPYETDTFEIVETGEPIHKADLVYMYLKGKKPVICVENI